MIRRGRRRQDVVGAVWTAADSAKASADVRKSASSRIQGRVFLSVHEHAGEDGCTQDGKGQRENLGDALHCLCI